MTASTPSTIAMHPTVLWAQRADLIYLTIEVHDTHAPTVTITPTTVTFEATAAGMGAGNDQKLYKASLDLHASIDPDHSSYTVGPRNVTFTLIKAEDSATFWPRLLAGKAGKPAWLKTDFARWKDEDDEDDEEPAAAPANPMAGMMGGGAGAGGADPFAGLDMSQFNFPPGAMRGMGGAGAGDSDDDEENEDEEELD
ncbi:HSP20-like chaperone [Blastocladiella britannica]|nr:HSP20-like chaperone [Blastocladiella britannica]